MIRNCDVLFHNMYLMSNTCISGELIQIGTVRLRSKRIFIHFPSRKFVFLLGATFIINLTKHYPPKVTFLKYINPPFIFVSAVF